MGGAHSLLRESLYRDGFVAVDDALTEHHIAEVRNLLDPLFERDELNFIQLGSYGSDDVPELLATSRVEKRLTRVQALKPLTTIANEIFARTSMFAGDHAIYKRAYGCSETAWHQDQIYDRSWLRQPSITMWIPLQNVDDSNGCMRFVRGSHKDGLFPHSVRDGDTRNHAMQATGFDHSRISVCPLKLGGLTIHLPGTLHSTGANRGNTVRRAWIVTFVPKGGYHLRRVINFGVRKLAGLS